MKKIRESHNNRDNKRKSVFRFINMRNILLIVAIMLLLNITYMGSYTMSSITKVLASVASGISKDSNDDFNLKRFIKKGSDGNAEEGYGLYVIDAASGKKIDVENHEFLLGEQNKYYISLKFEIDESIIPGEVYYYNLPPQLIGSDSSCEQTIKIENINVVVGVGQIANSRFEMVFSEEILNWMKKFSGARVNFTYRCEQWINEDVVKEGDNDNNPDIPINGGEVGGQITIKKTKKIPSVESVSSSHDNTCNNSYHTIKINPDTTSVGLLEGDPVRLVIQLNPENTGNYCLPGTQTYTEGSLKIAGRKVTPTEVRMNDNGMQEIVCELGVLSEYTTVSLSSKIDLDKIYEKGVTFNNARSWNVRLASKAWLEKITDSTTNTSSDIVYVGNSKEGYSWYTHEYAYKSRQTLLESEDGSILESQWSICINQNNKDSFQIGIKEGTKVADRYEALTIGDSEMDWDSIVLEAHDYSNGGDKVTEYKVSEQSDVNEQGFYYKKMLNSDGKDEGFTLFFTKDFLNTTMYLKYKTKVTEQGLARRPAISYSNKVEVDYSCYRVIDEDSEIIGEQYPDDIYIYADDSEGYRDKAFFEKKVSWYIKAQSTEFENLEITAIICRGLRLDKESISVISSDGTEVYENDKDYTITFEDNTQGTSAFPEGFTVQWKGAIQKPIKIMYDTNIIGEGSNGQDDKEFTDWSKFYNDFKGPFTRENQIGYYRNYLNVTYQKVVNNENCEKVEKDMYINYRSDDIYISNQILSLENLELKDTTEEAKEIKSKLGVINPRQVVWKIVFNASGFNQPMEAVSQQTDAILSLTTQEEMLLQNNMWLKLTLTSSQKEIVKSILGEEYSIDDYLVGNTYWFNGEVLKKLVDVQENDGKSYSIIIKGGFKGIQYDMYMLGTLSSEYLEKEENINKTSVTISSEVKLEDSVLGKFDNIRSNAKTIINLEKLLKTSNYANGYVSWTVTINPNAIQLFNEEMLQGIETIKMTDVLQKGLRFAGVVATNDLGEDITKQINLKYDNVTREITAVIPPEYINNHTLSVRYITAVEATKDYSNTVKLEGGSFKYSKTDNPGRLSMKQSSSDADMNLSLRHFLLH